jgi:hypothetical protein
VPFSPCVIVASAHRNRHRARDRFRLSGRARRVNRGHLVPRWSTRRHGRPFGVSPTSATPKLPSISMLLDDATSANNKLPTSSRMPRSFSVCAATPNYRKHAVTSRHDSPYCARLPQPNASSRRPRLLRQTCRGFVAGSYLRRVNQTAKPLSVRSGTILCEFNPRLTCTRIRASNCLRCARSAL